MRLNPPCDSIDFSTEDIYGEAFQLSALRGKRVMLSFFRDAACPFCNLRVYELTHRYKSWQQDGLEVIAMFSDTSDKVRNFVARHPRPFRMISDPELDVYNQYGVEHSIRAIFRAMLFKLPNLVRGFMTGGRPSNNPHIKIVPADFLIDETGKVTQVWYGRDTSDHIPLEDIQAFIDEGLK